MPLIKLNTCIWSQAMADQPQV